jgi:triacylglycerol lipase
MKSRVVALLAFLCCCSRGWSKEASDRVAGQDTVILVHGLGRTPLSMKKLEWTLKREGYAVINLSYPSTQVSVSKAADEWLAPRVAAIASNTRIHFVTHSLGGIVVRQFLQDHRMTNLGRVVMLAPPNRGSELADEFRESRLYRCLTGPAGQELGCGSSSLPNGLGRADFEVGIIAGDRSLNPWFSKLIPGPDDGKVSVRSAALEGMRDFLMVHHSHTWMMWSPGVNEAVARFLTQGRFARSSSSRCTQLRAAKS